MGKHEHENPYHMNSPEAHPYMAYNAITEELHSAAGRLWVPTDQANTFQYDTSAAGLRVAAVLPEQQHLYDAPRSTVTIYDPSRRLERALNRHVDDPCPYGNCVVFTIVHPQEAEHKEALGVTCAIFNEQDGDPLVYSYELPYGRLYSIMCEGGICEKASIAQRLGNWTLECLGAWAASEAANTDSIVWRRGHFGPW